MTPPYFCLCESVLSVICSLFSATFNKPEFIHVPVSMTTLLSDPNTHVILLN